MPTTPTQYPTDAAARAQILSAGRRLYERGLVAGNDGNISVRVSSTELWTTPTNVSKGYMTEDSLVKMNLSGENLTPYNKPSSEAKLHLEVYRADPEILAVVHAHPLAATTLAAAGIALDTALLQEAAVLLGVIPLVPYEAPGSAELAVEAAKLAPLYNGCLLEYHGAVAWSEQSLDNAVNRMEAIEFNAGIYLQSKAAGVLRPLPDSVIERLLTLRPAWGITRGGVPKGRKG
jgi:L-fuculose-phosphate aldolase